MWRCSERVGQQDGTEFMEMKEHEEKADGRLLGDAFTAGLSLNMRFSHQTEIVDVKYT